MSEMNAASAAPAKLCPNFSVEYFYDTAKSIGNLLEQLLLSTADLETHRGEFNDLADEDAKDHILRIAAAKVGLREMLDAIEDAANKLDDLQTLTKELESCTDQQQQAIRSISANFDELLLRNRKTEIELNFLRLQQSEREEAAMTGLDQDQDQGHITAISPEEVAERKLAGEPVRANRITIRRGDTAFDIEGTREFIDGAIASITGKAA